VRLEQSEDMAKVIVESRPGHQTYIKISMDLEQARHLADCLNMAVDKAESAAGVKA
jgi:hypothetical protein